MAGFEAPAGRVFGKDAPVPGILSVIGPTLKWDPDDGTQSQSFAVALKAISGESCHNQSHIQSFRQKSSVMHL